jgi:hypothetical protein
MRDRRDPRSGAGGGPTYRPTRVGPNTRPVDVALCFGGSATRAACAQPDGEPRGFRPPGERSRAILLEGFPRGAPRWRF